MSYFSHLFKDNEDYDESSWYCHLLSHFEIFVILGHVMQSFEIITIVYNILTYLSSVDTFVVFGNIVKSIVIFLNICCSSFVIEPISRCIADIPASKWPMSL